MALDRYKWIYVLSETFTIWVQSTFKTLENCYAVATKLYNKGSKVNDKNPTRNTPFPLVKLKLSDCFTVMLSRVVNVPDMAPSQSIPIEMKFYYFTVSLLHSSYPKSYWLIYVSYSHAFIPHTSNYGNINAFFLQLIKVFFLNEINNIALVNPKLYLALCWLPKYIWISI